MALNPTHRDMKKSVIEMEQMSWDDVFEVLARLQLTLNPVSNQLEKVTALQGNSSLALTYDSNGNLSRIDKTISGTTYRKTLTWSSGSLTNISTWSQV